MNRIFKCEPENFFEVPDQTLVNPFLNPKDANSGIPWETLDGLGVTAGVIKPGKISKIHVHPFISVVTVLLAGKLTIRMKDFGNDSEPYELELNADINEMSQSISCTATLATPGTFFQLDNSKGIVPAKVFYLSSPSFVFEPGKNTDDVPIYDDAIILGRDWTRLKEQNWNPPELSTPTRSFAARKNSLARLAAKAYGKL